MGHTPKLLLGLITHPGSHFNSDGEATERFRELGACIQDLGLNVETLISDRNEFDTGDQKIPMAQRLNSAWAQVKAEKAWAKYLMASRGSRKIDLGPGWLFYLGMFLKRAFSFLVSSRYLKRLANIDLSHLRVLKEGMASKADWILVVEDDGKVGKVQLVAEKISALIKALDDDEVDIFVNLSESIDHSELGAQEILARAKESLFLSDGAKVVHVTPPISNTVCANLYSRRFAIRFAEAIESQGILPSIPIDWRLNRVIMDSVGNDIKSFWVIPGIFIQGSMHDNWQKL